MRHVTSEPITVGDLEARARTGTNLTACAAGVTSPSTAPPGSQRPPGPAAVLRATAAGLRAREIWRPLPDSSSSAGAIASARISSAACEIPYQHGQRMRIRGCPDCLPILGAALRTSQGPDSRLPPRPDGTAPEALPLSARLSRVPLAFALGVRARSRARPP